MKKDKFISDESLIKDYQSGNEACLETLIHRHKSRVFTFIVRKVKNRELADDIFQDSFIKAVCSLKQNKYVEDGKFPAWLIRIAHNMIIDHFRKNKIKKEFLPSNDFIFMNGTPNELEHSIEDQIITQQTHKELNNLILLLPDVQKEVLHLRLFCDLSFKEIAEETNVSINTALGRMRYALINLKKLIEEKKIHVAIPTLQ